MDVNQGRKIHSQFNASDSDVTIQSSDGVLFLLHRKNLEITTGVFPGPEFGTNGETVLLTEKAEILEVVFQFLYPQIHPTLKELDFYLVFAVAEAVEKYEIFSAMRTCDVRLCEFAPKHAFKLFQHGIRHDRHAVLDAAAYHLLSRSASLKVWSTLPSYLRVPWTNYRNAWHKVIQLARNFVVEMFRPSIGCCERIYDESGSYFHLVCYRCRANLIAWLADLEDFDSITALKEETLYLSDPEPSDAVSITDKLCAACKGCHCRALRDLGLVVARHLDRLPPLSHFASPSDSDGN